MLAWEWSLHPHRKLSIFFGQLDRIFVLIWLGLDDNIDKQTPEGG